MEGEKYVPEQKETHNLSLKYQKNGCFMGIKYVKLMQLLIYFFTRCEI